MHSLHGYSVDEVTKAKLERVLDSAVIALSAAILKIDPMTQTKIYTSISVALDNARYGLKLVKRKDVTNVGIPAHAIANPLKAVEPQWCDKCGNPAKLCLCPK